MNSGIPEVEDGLWEVEFHKWRGCMGIGIPEVEGMYGNWNSISG